MIKDFVPSFYRPPSLTVVDDKILSVRQITVKNETSSCEFRSIAQRTSFTLDVFYTAVLQRNNNNSFITKHKLYLDLTHVYTYNGRTYICTYIHSYQSCRQFWFSLSYLYTIILKRVYVTLNI